MNVLHEKLKEVLIAVVPITVLTMILHFTFTPLDTIVLLRFLVGAAFIIVGLSIFLLGVDIGVTPIGELMGSTLTKTNRAWLIMLSGLVLGFFISIAEPDLHILASQVDLVTGGVISKTSIVIVVSLGIGVIIGLGMLRIVYNYPFFKMLTILYSLILGLSLLSSSEFISISFDASAASTGALVVPFVLALAIGISSMKADSKAAEEDSFGLVALAGVGAVISVLIMGIVFDVEQISGSLEVSIAPTSSIFRPFVAVIPKIALESFIALLPLVVAFLVFQKIAFHLSAKSVRKVIIGLIYTFIGLVFFLSGVNAGFMDVGAIIGHQLATFENKALVVIVAFVLGLVTILAEPAVYVLTHQVENVTSGYVRRNIVLVALSLGVAGAVALSVLKIVVPGIELWYYLLPGYALAITLSYFAPDLFVGIGFDSGTVASGPMTATFILAFSHGVASAIEGADIVKDGFGIIAMVALTPVIALQVLGLLFQAKSKKGGIETDAS